MGFVGTLDGIAVDESDPRSVCGVEISLLARAGNVMRAVQHRLHPAQPRVARRRDLSLRDGLLGQRHVASRRLRAASTLHRSSARGRFRLSAARRQNSQRCRTPLRRTAGSLERTTRTPSSSPMRRYISRQKSATLLASFVLKASTAVRLDVRSELARGVLAPAGRDHLQVERRELALNLVLESEIHRERLSGLAMAQRCLRFSRIVIAVVEEEHDLTADLLLQPPRGDEFGVQKLRGKKPQGCWPKQMMGADIRNEENAGEDGGSVRTWKATRALIAGVCARCAGRKACSTRLKITQVGTADRVQPQITNLVLRDSIFRRHRCRSPRPAP